MRVGDDWLLTPERVAVHLPTATAVLADAHLGYDESRRRRGEAVPLRGLEDLQRALDAVAARHGVRRLVVAGDLCEDAAGVALLPGLLRGLEERRIELAGVTPGNHDRALGRCDPPLPLCPDGVRLGDWLVVHGDRPLPPGRVVFGHFHPRFRWGGSLSAACYLVSAERIVLPAFSADAAGVGVVGVRRWHGYRCGVIAGERVLDFGDLSRLGRAPSGK